MKAITITLLAVTLLTTLSGCQKQCCNCPCQIPTNPITPKDCYYHNYYQSEPVN